MTAFPSSVHRKYCLSIERNRKLSCTISFRPSSGEHARGCELCIVDRPTGTLHVNTEIDINQTSFGPNNCSLIFKWTSKTKTLLALDKKFLQEPQRISSLPIFVDFLPALESLKPTPSGAGGEHDYFIVPKHCNVGYHAAAADNDDDDDDDFPYRWRKSWCMAEIHALTSEMSDKHRRCYQIMKFLFHVYFIVISNYHVKTVLLRHHTTCSDTTDECVDCVLGMLRDLLQAYETEELLSYKSNLNLLGRKGVLLSSRFRDVRHSLNVCTLSLSLTHLKTFIRKIRKD